MIKAAVAYWVFDTGLPEKAVCTVKVCRYGFEFSSQWVGGGGVRPATTGGGGERGWGHCETPTK